MSLHLLDEVENLFTPDLIERATVSLGEGGRGIGKAVSGLLPSVLRAMAWRTNVGKTGSDQLLRVSKEMADPGGPGFQAWVAPPPYSEFFCELFGNRLGEVRLVVSAYAEIDEGSVDALVDLAFRASLTVIGKYATENKLTPEGLAVMMFTQRREFENAIPRGLAALDTLLVPGSPGGTGSANRKPDRGGYPRAGRRDEKESWSLRWLFPLLIILLALSLVCYFGKRW